VTGELYSEPIITFQVGAHGLSCEGKSWVRCVTGEIVGLVPHRKLIVGEHNIKVRVVLTHQASLLG
jgi:hypothetical protein